MPTTTELIAKFEEKRAELLHMLCEDERIFIPEVIFQIVTDIRSITKLLKVLRGDENGTM